MDACEEQRAETLLGNAILPVTVAEACSAAGIPWAHISSGCIYSGGKVRVEGGWRVERDLNTPRFRELFQKEPQLAAGVAMRPVRTALMHVLTCWQEEQDRKRK